MNTNLPPFKIFSGTKSHYLAEAICAELGVELGKMNIQHFADGEFEVSFEESIRGCEVFLVQSTFPNTDNLMELLLMIDAAKRASAKSVIAVVPYFGWARQDRKDKPRVSIAAKLVADLLSTAGIDRLIRPSRILCVGQRGQPPAILRDRISRVIPDCPRRKNKNECDNGHQIQNHRHKNPKPLIRYTFQEQFGQNKREKRCRQNGRNHQKKYHLISLLM